MVHVDTMNQRERAGMAQNSKDAQKRTSRAERRAAEAAAMKARAEKLEKERKQQTMIGAIVVAVLVILIAIGAFSVYQSIHQSATSEANSITMEEAYDELQAVENTPSLVDDKGGLLISKNGYGTSVEGVPTIAIYMDFLCPGCGNIHRQLDDDLQKMVNAGQINLELHFMSFMDRWSTDEYSSRAANAAMYLAEHDSDPNHMIAFLKNMYAEEFQPEEGSSYESVSDKQIKQQMIDAGVSEDVANNAFNRDYQDWLDAINTYTPKRSELWNVSGNYEGSMTTPTITINGKFWDMNQLSVAQETIHDGLLESIGLQSDQIGVEGKAPSIGSDKDPISNTTGE